MSVPDHRQIVERVFAQGGHTLVTKDGAGRFAEAAASALHAVDASWGHLRKPEGRTHVVDARGNRHAVDVVLYRSNGQIVDIIRDAGEPGAALSWGPGEEHEYSDSDWYAPNDDPPPLDDAVLVELKRLGEQQTILLAHLVEVEEAMGHLLIEVRKVSSLTAPTYHAEGTIALPRALGGTVPYGVTLTPEPPK